MKVYESQVVLPITWTFASDGRTLRSSVVAGHQAEIFKGQLTIRRPCGAVIVSTFCQSRAKGIKLASKLLKKVL